MYPLILHKRHISEIFRLDFTMCNPPFYSSREEMIASAEAKERPPFSVSPKLNEAYRIQLKTRHRHAQEMRLRWSLRAVKLLLSIA
jgi:23S rRNA A1618 N6-methylase RlmF